MKLSTKVITAVLLVAGGTGGVYAISRHHDWQMTPTEKVEFVTERVTKKLDLNLEQRHNFTELAELVAQILLDAKSTRQQDIAEIGELLMQSNLNQARALELVQQKTQLVNTQAPLVISSLAIFLDSLNPEQKQQLQGILQQRHKHRRADDGR